MSGPTPGDGPVTGSVLLHFQGGSRPGLSLRTGSVPRGRDLQHILEHEFGVLMSLQAVYDLLHRHGFSSLMPRPHHKVADEELQAIFKEVVADQIEAIREAHPNEQVPGLVRGRGPVPAGDADAGLGTPRVAAARRAADRVHLSLRADGRLRTPGRLRG